MWMAMSLSIVSATVGQQQADKPVVPMDAGKVVETASQFYHRREEVVRQLIEIVDGPDGIVVPKNGQEDCRDALLKRSHSPKAGAIWLLGAFRANEAVPVLARNLTYEIFPNVVAGYGDMSNLAILYPCTKALASIGLPAVNAMYRTVRHSSDDLTTRLALHTLVQIQGVKATQSALADARHGMGPTVSANVERALKMLEDEYDAL
jgi:hypothetical protein